jgi:hypothetical protein
MCGNRRGKVLLSLLDLPKHFAVPVIHRSEVIHSAKFKFFLNS